MISISFWWLYFFPEHWIIERLVDNWWNFILLAVLYIYRIVWLKIDWLRLVTCHTTYWHSNSGVKMKCASADQSKIGDSITVQQPVQIKTQEKERKHQTQYGVMTKLSVRQSGTDKKKTCRTDNNLLLPVRMTENISGNFSYSYVSGLAKCPLYWQLNMLVIRTGCQYRSFQYDRITRVRVSQLFSSYPHHRLL